MMRRRACVAALLALTQASTQACAAGVAKKKPAVAAPNIPPGPPDARARRAIAGGMTADDLHLGVESPELASLREAEAQMFLPAAREADVREPTTAPLRLPREVSANSASNAPLALWGAALKPSDLPAKVDARVIKYLEFFKSDPRGRAVMSYWLRRRGRYRAHIEAALARRHMPLDLQWLALIESGQDPAARSPVGAAGLWQFMPDTCRAYGLGYTRWIDQRLDPFAQTDAAVMMLSDLYTRFGSWELAMASYNYGYGGVMSSVKHFNTTDFSQLTQYESALPWETTLYVPKIVAAAIVARNLEVFGFHKIDSEPAVEVEKVSVPSGVTLSLLASQSSINGRELELLNAHLRAKRTPPGDPTLVYVPKGKAPAVERVVATLKGADPTELYSVRFGETLASVAESTRATTKQIAQLNDLKSDELLRPGTLLFIPKRTATTLPVAHDKVAVVVPREVLTPAGRTRAFYTVIGGDALPDIAAAFGVSVSDLVTWNALDASARLHEGMTLQVFPETNRDLRQVRYIADEDAVVVRPGTEEFFALYETKGRTRKVVPAKAGDTLAKVAVRERVNVVLLERINRKGRTETLETGKPIVIYVPPPAGAPPKLPATKAGAKPDAAKAGTKVETTTTTTTTTSTTAPVPSKDTELPPLP